MAEMVTGNRSRQIWVTRSHLAALGVTTLALTVLAFFVGIRVGRSELLPAPQAKEALVPDADQQAVLEALLREVETASANAAPAAEPTSLSVGLTVDPTPVAAEVPESKTVSVLEGGAVPEGPSADPAAPTSGWAVQVGSYEAQAEADARVASLRALGLSAYRTAALVKGVTWHRVRVGGYATKEAATESIAGLAAQVGSSDLMVAEAP